MEVSQRCQALTALRPWVGCSFPVGSTHPVPKEQTPVPSLLSLPCLTWPLHATRSVLFPATLPPATLNPFYPHSQPHSQPAPLPSTPTYNPGSFSQFPNNSSLKFRLLLITLVSGSLLPQLSSKSGLPLPGCCRWLWPHCSPRSPRSPNFSDPYIL